MSCTFIERGRDCRREQATTLDRSRLYNGDFRRLQTNGRRRLEKWTVRLLLFGCRFLDHHLRVDLGIRSGIERRLSSLFYLFPDEQKSYRLLSQQTVYQLVRPSGAIRSEGRLGGSRVDIVFVRGHVINALEHGL